MHIVTEPYLKKSSCSYCGDSPINHSFSYWEDMISIIIDTYGKKFITYTPNFIKDFVDWIPMFLFESFAFLKLAKFSSDINKANTFRSRVIWEEAQRMGIIMEQIILFGKPLDHYKATLNGKNIYFQSIPIPPKFSDIGKNWDNKIFLKEEFFKHNIPIPLYFSLPLFHLQSLEQIFSKFKKPIIIKPRVGSLARHTVTSIYNLQQFRKGITVAKQICPYLVVEEHLDGDVCRATLVDGVLAGFQWASSPSVVGDGRKTILQLIKEKNSNRPNRVECIGITQEVHDYISRLGFSIDDVLPDKVHLPLSHRRGRLWGGRTKEMIDELHPSFIPVLEKAVKITGLALAGFDCVIPDPTKDANSQKWGIIECNTLPFIDLHYYALEGKPRNIAGMIWDMWI